MRLAEICGMHRNYLGAVERAERTPSIVAADRVARALGMTLSETVVGFEEGRARQIVNRSTIKAGEIMR